MKNFKEVFKNDWKNLYKYRIFHMIIIVSVIFALAMGFFPEINPLLFIYLSLFIIPVISHSITLFIEQEEDTLFPVSREKRRIYQVLPAKLLSAISLQLIPLLFYILIFIFVLHVNFSIILFILTYILSLSLHMVIAYSITIIAKSHISMSLSYIGYIIIFSLIPFIYLMNLMPEGLDYLFIFSPAYLAHVLFDNITFGYLFSDKLLIILAALLQVIILSILVLFVIVPYYRKDLNKNLRG
jgi:hypothetical protein